MDELSVALFFSTKYSDIKAGWFVHSSTNAIIMLIEVKGRSVGHGNAEEKRREISYSKTKASINLNKKPCTIQGTLTKSGN